MGSRLGGVVLTLLVLALLFVPAAVSAYPDPGPTEVGFNMPATVAVAPGSSFTVNLTIYNPNNLQLNAAGADVVWTNASLLNVTDITDTDWPISLTKWWDNSTGELAYEGGGSMPILWLNATNITHCVVHFAAANVEGSTAVNFIHSGYVDTLVYNTSTVDVLNWTAVTNMTVIISNGATCCADINNNETSAREGGNVSIDAVMQSPPYPSCKQDSSLDHTFTVQAYPDEGWQFVGWTGNVNDTNANPANITITGGATDTVTANFYHLPAELCVDTNLVDFGDLYQGSSNPANKTFTVTNCGGHTLNWTSNLSYDPTNPNTTCTWCNPYCCTPRYSYSPISGGPLSANQSDVIEVAVDIANLTEGGRYNATINITGSSSEQVRVTFYLLPLLCKFTCRDIVLPHGGYVRPGESFDVCVDFESFAGNWSNVTLVDNTTVTNSNGDPLFWDSVVQIEEDPPASSKRISGTGNTSVEYHWAGNYTPDTKFIVHYNVTVPPGTPAGWYNMTVCPENTTAWMEFYIDEIAYTNCIYCAYRIKVNSTTLKGNMSFPGNAAGRVMTVHFFNNTTHAEEPWSPINAATDANGNFTVGDITPGLYDIGVKNCSCLSEMERGISLTVDNTAYVDFGNSREGDSNNDDRVRLVDFSKVLNAHGTQPGEPGWDSKCDFDRSGKVNLLDFSLVLNNYGLDGDIYEYLH